MVDPILDEGVWATVDDGCNMCSHSELWRRHAEEKIRYEGWKALWLHRKGDHVFRSGNEYNKRKTEGSTGCTLGGIWSHHSRLSAHTHEILVNSHPLLLSLACQAKLAGWSMFVMFPSHWTIAVVRNWKLSGKQELVVHESKRTFGFPGFSVNTALSELILDEDDFPASYRSGNLAADVQVRGHASFYSRINGECVPS